MSLELALLKGRDILCSEHEKLRVAHPFARKPAMPVRLDTTWIIGRDGVDDVRPIWKVEAHFAIRSLWFWLTSFSIRGR